MHQDSITRVPSATIPTRSSLKQQVCQSCERTINAPERFTREACRTLCLPCSLALLVEAAR